MVAIKMVAEEVVAIKVGVDEIDLGALVEDDNLHRHHPK